MAGYYKLIPEISPNKKNWQAKVIVAEKLAPKQAKHSSSRYQNMVLMDLKGNKVHTTLYDGNITAFEDKLLLSKTYIISNALVKETKPEYRSSNGDMQWTISGKTRIEEVNENNMEFLYSTYTITPFDELEKHMDCDIDISILAVAITMRPKRLIQTRAGNQTCVQDILLIDRRFHTIILTMWDSYVEKECVFLADNIAKKPVILANRLKVSSFNGLTLSTKINSTFFIDATFNQVTEFRAWIETHNDKLNEIALEKPCLTVTPTKLSPPDHKKFAHIEHIKSQLLGRKYFWVKAKATIKATKQTLWYMSCSNCNKVSRADFGETFPCIYCKYPTAKAVPRANANVELEDTTGVISASAIGNPAEILLKYSADSLMQLSKSGNVHEFIQMDAEEHIFYVKVTQLERNTTEYKYEIIFVLNAYPALANKAEETSEKDKSFLCSTEVGIDCHCHSPRVSPSAKRTLFQASTEPGLSNIKAEKKLATSTSNSENDKVGMKGKLD